MKIPFNIPYISGNEVSYINDVIKAESYSFGGIYAAMCEKELTQLTGCPSVRMTNSCTSALEIAALAIDIQPGDEVILPSFTFVSTANAFVLRGANLVFVDINPETMCLDENLLEKAVSEKTKAIVLMHYTGFTSDLKKVKSFCKKHHLFLIEDAAQSIDSYVNNQHLGTFGDLGCISFHDTKNIHCGEGGALLINNKDLADKIDVILQNGTNRKEFLKGIASTYTWKGLGSSYGMSEINASFLMAQLKEIKKVTQRRLELYKIYEKCLSPLKEKGLIDFPNQPPQHNAHIFFIKLKNQKQRNDLAAYLQKNDIVAYFHYLPLHLSEMGKNYQFISENNFTQKESERLIRLPMYFNLSEEYIEIVVNGIQEYFSK